MIMRGGVLTRKPADEQSANQTQEVAENRDRFGDNPRDRPEHQSQTDPSTSTEQTLLVHDIGATENANIDVLDSHVAQDDTRDDNCRNSDTVGDFAEQRTGRAQRGRGDTVTGVAVDHGSGDGVEDDFESLLHAERFREVFGVLHFGDEAKVTGVAT